MLSNTNRSTIITTIACNNIPPRSTHRTLRHTLPEHHQKFHLQMRTFPQALCQPPIIPVHRSSTPLMATIILVSSEQLNRITVATTVISMHRRAATTIHPDTHHTCHRPVQVAVKTTIFLQVYQRVLQTVCQQRLRF